MFSLAALLPLPVSAAIPLKPPIDPAPIGHGVDYGTPIDLLELEDSMLAVFEINRGNPKYVAPEIYARPIDRHGNPTSAAQRFIATGRHGAAAAADEVALIVWVHDGIQGVLVDSTANALSSQVKIADRRAEVSLTPGATDLHVSPTSEGWLVAWTYRSGVTTSVEAISLDRDLSPISEVHRLQDRAGLLSLTPYPGGIALLLRDEAGIGLYKYANGQLSERFSIPSSERADGGSLEWGGDRLGLLIPEDDDLQFASVPADFSSVQIEELVAGPESCHAPDLEWIGHGWIATCQLIVGNPVGVPRQSAVYRLAADGTMLDPDPLIHEGDLFTPLFSFGEVWTLDATEGVMLHRWRPMKFEPEAVLSARAANTVLLSLTRWSHGNWLLLYLQEDRLTIDILSRSGSSLLPEPLDLGVQNRTSSAAYHRSLALAQRNERMFIIAGDVDDPTTVIIVELRQTSPLEPEVSMYRLQLEGEVVVQDATAGESGLFVYYTSAPWGRTIHNLVLLDEQMEPIAERKFGSTFPPIHGIAAVGPNFFLGLAWEGFGIELLDSQLQTLVPRASVIPRSMNPAQPVMSANDDNLLISWINSNDHVRTVVLDADGEVVGGEGDGTVVALGGEYDESLAVTPAGEGWWISWLSSDSRECDETTYIHRIRVDSLGQLITPFPHDPIYQMDSSCATVRLAPDGSAVIRHLRRYEGPYGGATRGLLQFAPARLRGVARP